MSSHPFITTMSLLNRLLNTFQPSFDEEGHGPERTVFSYTQPLAREIKRLADHEGIGADEMTVEILQAGIADRRAYHRSVTLWHTLTPKEQQVAAYICLNWSNDEIAEQLDIPRGTVRTHVRHILQKFRVEGRAEVREMLRWWEFEG